MQKLFKAEVFNGNISSWDVSKVTSMSAMFQAATSFNQSLSNLNVSNVEDHDNDVLWCLRFQPEFLQLERCQLQRPIQVWHVSPSCRLLPPEPFQLACVK
jgi:hypothetical protein